MISTKSFFVVFLFGSIIYYLVDANCDPHIDKNCNKKESKKTTFPSLKTTTKIPITKCNNIECEAKGKQFCICASFNHQNHSSHWPVPKSDKCPSIGCSQAGNDCSCFKTFNYDCECNEIYQCNKKQCASQSLYSGCYCYFGEKAIRTYDIPISKNCSDLLKEIGDPNGRYQCSAISCNCDQYGDCICKPPKNKNPPAEKRKQCVYENCQKRSFEFCQCTKNDCSNGACNNDIVFQKLPKGGICLGMLNSSYECKNVGQKCSCVTDCDGTKYQNKGSNKTECACVEVDPLDSGGSGGSCGYCQSSGTCICTYENMAIQIPNSPKSCKTLEKSSGNQTNKFDACPYRDGQDCTCELNPNNHQKQCFCRDTLKRIPPFNLKPNPQECCNYDRDCVEHSKIYCYCTNYVDNTYVKNVSLYDIAKLPNEEFDSNAVEKICYAFGHPPDISCHSFGYRAKCVLGFCNLKPINLYYSTTQ